MVLLAVAYGEVSVLRKKNKKERQKKDQEEEKGEEREVTVELKEDAVLPAKTMGDASTCLSIDDGNGEFSVELKCETVSETVRILLGTKVWEKRQRCCASKARADVLCLYHFRLFALSLSF